jgi:hypothetical protein
MDSIGRLQVYKGEPHISDGTFFMLLGTNVNVSESV